MKSDVIRKRARHDARRAGGTSSETPSASPGASRRATPENGTPTLAPDSSTSDDSYPPTQSELMSALGQVQQQQQGEGNENSYMHYTYGTTFPGPYHPDYLSGNMLGYPSDESDIRSLKRRRLSNDSTSEPPSSTTSYSSYTDSSISSSSSSQRSSLEFPFSYSAFGLFRGPTAASYWHPPMLPPDHSPQYIHPPMLPPDDSPMDYLHNMHNEETEALFNTYMHPPMLPNAEDSPKVSLGSPRPPMLAQEWSTAYDFSSHDNAMQAY
jgi:GATA-binding protein, other eukaryote